MADLLSSAAAAGLLWFPFVLGLGLSYRYLKIVDVSIDGVVVVAGIATAGTWAATNSYAMSLMAGAVTGAAAGLLVGTVIYILRIDALLAGILASLALHSLSVVLVGESLVLRNTALAGDAARLWPILAAACLGLAAISAAAYRTNLGVLARALGSNPRIESPLAPEFPTILAMGFSGLLVGIGAGLYVHVESVARAGSGFEFLLTGLTSFLVPDRIVAASGRILSRIDSAGPGGRLARAIVLGLRSVWVMALVGSILFQSLIYMVITFSPRPDLWKLLLAGILLLTLAEPYRRRRHADQRLPFAGDRTADAWPALVVDGLSKTFHDARPPRAVLSHVTFRCVRGLAALTGWNGAGKTSLLRCLSGEIEPDCGMVMLGSQSLRDKRVRRRCLFYLRQEPHSNLAGDLSLFENLVWVTAERRPLLAIATVRAVGRHLREVAPELSAQVLPRLQTSARDLSGGEAQCAAIVMAAISKRPVLLADEPTANLDRDNQHRIRRMLREAAADAIVLAATHDTLLVADADARLAVQVGPFGGFVVQEPAVE